MTYSNLHPYNITVFELTEGREKGGKRSLMSIYFPYLRILNKGEENRTNENISPSFSSFIHHQNKEKTKKGEVF